jgi:hypothetical protein
MIFMFEVVFGVFLFLNLNASCILYILGVLYQVEMCTMCY